jgi:D-amino-acid oxidase
LNTDLFDRVSLTGTEAAERDRKTWIALADLAQNRPEAGVHFQGNHNCLLTGGYLADVPLDCEIHSRAKDRGSATEHWFAELLSTNPWFKDVVPNVRNPRIRQLIVSKDANPPFLQFRSLPKDQLPPGTDAVTVFTSVCINTAIYLPWLVSQCLANGVLFKRAVFAHISDAATTAPGLHPADGPVDLIVNCTGLNASTLGGVEDKSVVPARGQIVLVRNDAGGRMLNVSGTDDGSDEACYVMTRAAGGGTILGGCYQEGSWDPQVDPNLAVRIMKRGVEMCPQLTGGRGIEGLDVIRHGVGLRPVRKGGVRIERESVAEKWVVHNYGAGGAGYQNSYGCAQDAVDLVDEVLMAPKGKL